MEKPPYDYQALQKEIKRIDKNVEILETEVKKERERRVEIMFYIKEHERYRQHQIKERREKSKKKKT
jgi:hypothetical protein